MLYIYIMHNTSEIQNILFEQIRERLPLHTSFVHEIAELLEISYDSAYRRIRGEKALDINDLCRLAVHFKLSLDTILNLEGNKILFDYFTVDPEKISIKDWLRLITIDTRKIAEAADKEIVYAAKDPPIFQFFQLPELAAFKIFVWQKTLCQFPEFIEKQFSLDEADPEIMNIGKQLLAYSTKIPTTEIWNEDTLNITLRQIEYYRVSGFFKKEDDIFNLCDKLEQWFNHLRKQAEHGFKFLYGEATEGIENSYKMYENEVVLNDNSIIVKRDDIKLVYLTFNTLSLLVTQDPSFCSNVSRYHSKLMKKSNLISVTGSKERDRFFNKLLSNVGEFRKRME